MNSRSLTAVGALVLAISGAGAQEPTPVRIESYSLPNGLRVHLVEDHSSQVAAVDVWYDVGARNELPGRTGLAHLFEHMMFQGSAHLAKTEHSRLIRRAGGVHNASTQHDVTNYYQTVPSNRVNLALWLEAERMRGLSITADALKNQIETVKEERRERFDNQAYAYAVIEGTLRAFDAKECFGYAHPVIGSMSDLGAATVDEVQAFFRTYYAPNNAVVTVVGDFTSVDVKHIIAAYFGGIPRQPAPPAVKCGQSVRPESGRQVIQDDKATLPAVLAVYRVPPTAHADSPALSLLATILGQGESSRLNRIMARETKAALGAQAVLNPFGARRGPGLFMGLAIANQGVSADSVERLLIGEISRIAQSAVTEVELSKAKNQQRAAQVSRRQHAFALAEAVQHANLFLGTPEAVNTELRRYSEVTIEDVRRVAASYLTTANLLSIVVVPEKH